MARSLCSMLCMLILLQGFLSSAQATTFPALSITFNSETIRLLASARTLLSGTATYTASCSSTSVASYKSNSIAYAYSSNTAETQAVVDEAVKAAAGALADAATSSNGKCRSTEDTSGIYLVAEACARAMIKGRTSSLSYAYTKGSAISSSSGCAYSSAYAGALVRGLAGAVSKAISGSANSNCGAFSTTEGKAYVEAVAKATVNGLAISWTSAYAYGSKKPSQAIAASGAIYSNDLSVYATAIAKLFSYACARCTAGDNHCVFCKNWAIPEGDSVLTETFGVAAKGRVALAEAISDASSRICSKTITVDTAVKGLAVAISNVYVQITTAAYGWAASGNNAYACTGAVASTSAFGLSETYAVVVADAWALALKKDLCSAEAVANVFAEATARVEVDKIITSHVAGCTGKKSNTYLDFASRCYDHVYDVFAESCTNAFAGVVTDCNCAGNCWCCNDSPDKRQCIY